MIDYPTLKEASVANEVSPNIDKQSSVRLLVSSSGPRSTIFLGLTSSGVGNQQRPVVLEQNLLDLSLLVLVDIFLVVCNNSFREGLTDRIDLGNVSSTSDSDSDIEVLEALETEQEDGFEDFDSQRLGF